MANLLRVLLQRVSGLRRILDAQLRIISFSYGIWSFKNSKELFGKQFTQERGEKKVVVRPVQPE